MATLRICCIGDSITNGTGDAAMLGWPGRLCAAERARGHDVTLYNLGVRADTSELVAARWGAESRARLPDSVDGRLVFAFGVNDTAEQPGTGIRVPLARSVRAAETILREAKSWRPTLWIGPAPVEEGVRAALGSAVGYDLQNTRIAEYDLAYADVARALGVPYLSVYPRLRDDAAWRSHVASGDGVHPVAEGYATLAAVIDRWDAWRAWFD